MPIRFPDGSLNFGEMPVELREGCMMALDRALTSNGQGAQVFPDGGMVTVQVDEVIEREISGHRRSSNVRLRATITFEQNAESIYSFNDNGERIIRPRADFVKLNAVVMPVPPPAIADRPRPAAPKPLRKPKLDGTPRHGWF